MECVGCRSPSETNIPRVNLKVQYISSRGIFIDSFISLLLLLFLTVVAVAVAGVAVAVALIFLAVLSFFFFF